MSYKHFLETSSQDVFKKASKDLQDVFQTGSQEFLSKTSSRRLQEDVLQTRLVSTKVNACWEAIMMSLYTTKSWFLIDICGKFNLFANNIDI